MSGITVRVLGPRDAGVLRRVAPDVFDHPVDPALVHAFLTDPGHRIAVAVDAGVVIGFATGVRYIHPDKPWALWINEVGVAPGHRRRGVGSAVVRALLAAARSMGCTEGWVGTEADNRAAIALYGSVGGVRDPEQPFVAFRFPLAK